MISLNQLLESRDARAQHQKDLLGKYPGKSLLCLTVQLPGPEKRNDVSLKIARAGVNAIRESFAPVFEELRDLETGFEGYFLVQLEPFAAKRLTCQIEDSHPLGRLMDIDVIATHIVGREEIGLPPRRCLLCNQPARYCMRARTHTVADLLDKIEQMVNSYEKL